MPVHRHRGARAGRCAQRPLWVSGAGLWQKRSGQCRFPQREGSLRTPVGGSADLVFSLLLPRVRALFLLSSQDPRAPGGNPNSVSSDIPSSPGLSAGRVLGKKQSIFCRKIFSYNLTRKTHHVQDLVKNAESSDFFRWLSIAPTPSILSVNLGRGPGQVTPLLGQLS